MWLKILGAVGDTNSSASFRTSMVDGVMEKFSWLFGEPVRMTPKAVVISLGWMLTALIPEVRKEFVALAKLRSIRVLLSLVRRGKLRKIPLSSELISSSTRSAPGKDEALVTKVRGVSLSAEFTEAFQIRVPTLISKVSSISVRYSVSILPRTFVKILGGA